MVQFLIVLAGAVVALGMLFGKRPPRSTCPHGLPEGMECRACLEQVLECIRKQIEGLRDESESLPTTVIESAICRLCGEEVLVGHGRAGSHLVCRNGHEIANDFQPRAPKPHPARQAWRRRLSFLHRRHRGTTVAERSRLR